MDRKGRALTIAALGVFLCACDPDSTPAPSLERPSLEQPPPPAPQLPAEPAAPPAPDVAEAAPAPGPAENVLRVGPGEQYARPSDAARAAKEGDVIEIAAGVYAGDTVCTTKSLTFRGIGGRAHFQAVPVPGKSWMEETGGQGPGCTGKGFLVLKGANYTVENLEFSGAVSSSQNGAGIRLEHSGTVTIRNSYFHHNQNGVLGGKPGAEVVIEDSEFAFNGKGDGLTHNIYVSNIAKLVVRNIKSHHAKKGHLLKTRSRETHVIASQFYDGEDGNSSFQLDISGGVAHVLGNHIQKGPLSANAYTVLNYYTSRDPQGPHELYVQGNTFISYHPIRGAFVRVRAGEADAVRGSIEGNTFLAKRGPGWNAKPPRPYDYNYKPIVALRTP